MEDKDIFENRIDLTALRESVDQIKKEIGKIIIGQERMIDLLIVSILSDGHALLEGVPGVAKTLTAKLMAKVISADFSRIQFTPDLMPSDVLGTSIFNVKKSEFEFKKGPVFSNIILVDEINRAPAKTQAALFEVMEEKQVTIDGHTYMMSEPYIIIATQNPIEQEGTYRLPEAQLDRFLFKINVGYPSAEEETTLLKEFNKRKENNDINQIQAILTAENIISYREKVREIMVEEHLFTYISSIVHETRKNQALYLGASPRASLAILSSAKAFAAIRGRDFITPEDIKDVAGPVMRHRVILTPEKEMEGSNADEVINEIISKVEVPR
jgi:MoxR-like ATPase